MKTLKKIAFLFLSSLIIFCITGCGDNQSSKKIVKLNFKTPSSGDTVSWPLPLKVKGKVSNYKELSEKTRKNLRVYLVEQSTREKIWHVEPQARVDRKGNWKALTWLGSPKHGNRNRFRLCAFATNKKLKLKDGDHPVKAKPGNIGESCIKLYRKDR